MAVFKFYDATVFLNGTGGPPPTGGTQATHVHQLVLDYKTALLDVTEFSMQTKVNLSGLYEWSVKMDCWQDFAAAQINVLLWPLVGAASFYIQVKASSAATSVTNPQYYGLCVLEGYQPITGKVGDVISFSAQFNCAGALTQSST